jgi:hypothetical protein
MNYIKERTPLWQTFFSGQNISAIQIGLRDTVIRDTGYRIDPQSEDDLRAIMGKVYTNYYRSTGSVPELVRTMNMVVIKETSEQVKSGILQQMYYLRDRSTGLRVLDQPVNTSTYGKKVPINDKFLFSQ